MNPSSFNFSRRKFLHRCGMGMGALGLEGILQADSVDNTVRNHFPIRAKRVIHFFLNGGPSHVDTFDPKPSLEKYAGKERNCLLASSERSEKLAQPFLHRLNSKNMVPVDWNSVAFFQKLHNLPMILQ